MIKISVIIPAYNAEKTLSKAIDSVLAQSLNEIEIIVVDDGSTDSTRLIIESYGSKVRTILKDNNEGLSAARNSAFDIANGEYVTYVDADDFVEPDFYASVIALANDADLVVSGAYHDALDDSGNVAVTTINKCENNLLLTSSEDILGFAADLDSKRLFAFTWNKLYKRKLLVDLGLEFKDRALIEDFVYNIELWPKLSSVSVTSIVGYHYVKFSSESLSLKYLPDFFSIMVNRYELMKSVSGLNHVVANVHIKHVVAGMVRLFMPKADLSFVKRCKVIKEILSHTSSIEAMENCRGDRAQERVTNFVFSTKCVILNYLFASAIYKMQTSRFKLFDRLK